MNMQVINSLKGQPEYVLLPVKIYHALRKQIEAQLQENTDYVDFQIEDYVDNPVSLARMQAQVTQKALAEQMQVSQAYISKLETKTDITVKTLSKVKKALKLLTSASNK